MILLLLFIIFILILLLINEQKKSRNLSKTNTELSKYQGILDIDAEIAQRQASIKQQEDDALLTAKKIIAEAETELKSAREKKLEIISQAKDKATEIAEQSGTQFKYSQGEAEKIICQAKEQAKSIAGEAYTIKENADKYTSIVTAMLNKIDGYGNRYIIPGRTLLDDIADEYGYDNIAKDYKSAQMQISLMVETRTAADCDYVEPNRKKTAVDFVIDAFNGKVAVIISKIKKDNYGKLRQEMLDAFTLVNHNGNAFRNARIKRTYLDEWLNALRLGTLLYEMKERDKEEQRAIKEKMREEERARREIEKALRDAAKEESMLQKAMEKVKAQYDAASEEQKAKYEEQLKALEEKVKETEERKKRAQSMAEQTRRGHIYIISNIGSFGDGVYKIGMTRRIDPLDRVRELGDASVPFSFDVHAMIWSEDAPSLENAMHKHFALERINKINARKEFFRTTIANIRDEIEALGVNNIKWTMQSEAREYQESVALEKQFADAPEARDAWLVANTRNYDNTKVAALVGTEDETEDE